MHFLLTLFTLLSPLVPAYVNGAVDLSQEFGEVRDQGFTNFCHSFVAADLIDEALGKKNFVSALDVALSIVDPAQELLEVWPDLYLEKGKPIELRAADVWYAIVGYGIESKLLYENSICTEKGLPSEGEDRFYISSALSGSRLNSQIKPKSGVLRQTCIRQSVKNFDGLSLSKLRYLDLTQLKDEKELEQELISILDRNRPIAVAFQMYPVLSKHQPISIATHYAILVGYKKQKNNTQFKLRHTFGSECKVYDRHKIDSCVDGYQQIETSNFLRYLEEAYYFDSRL